MRTDGGIEVVGRRQLYDAVYSAERPELFFQGGGLACARPRRSGVHPARRAVGVPEPELALVINQRGTIVGYTTAAELARYRRREPALSAAGEGNDGSCALGQDADPEEPLPPDTTIALTIIRNGTTVFRAARQAQMRRRRKNWSIPVSGDQFARRRAVTGTGVMPPTSRCKPVPSR